MNVLFLLNNLCFFFQLIKSNSNGQGHFWTLKKAIDSSRMLNSHEDLLAACRPLFHRSTAVTTSEGCFIILQGFTAIGRFAGSECEDWAGSRMKKASYLPNWFSDHIVKLQTGLSRVGFFFLLNHSPAHLHLVQLSS